MKRIIVPIDFSEEAMNGITLAMTLAQKHHSTIQFVYVQLRKPDIGHVGIADERRIAQEEFEKLIERLRPEAPEGVNFEYIIKQGRVYQEVTAQAESFEESVIATSTHGASGFEEFFLGSNTLRILASTDRPTYTIRHGVYPRPLKNIILPLDTSFESRQKAPYVAKLAKAWGATVHVLSIVESPNPEVKSKLQSYSTQVEQFLAEREVPFVSALSKKQDFIDSTIEYTLEVNGDLIAINTRDRDTSHLLMIGEKAQRLISRAPVPVLVLAPHAEPIRGSFKTFGG